MAKKPKKPVERPDVLPERVIVTEYDTNWDKVMPANVRGMLDAVPSDGESGKGSK